MCVSHLVHVRESHARWLHHHDEMLSRRSISTPSVTLAAGGKHAQSSSVFKKKQAAGRLHPVYLVPVLIEVSGVESVLGATSRRPPLHARERERAAPFSPTNSPCQTEERQAPPTQRQRNVSCCATRNLFLKYFENT